jgi:hypothetical protein
LRWAFYLCKKKMLKHEREMLLFVAFQGAIGTLAAFIGYFVVGVDDINAMFRFTAYMLTDALRFWPT